MFKGIFGIPCPACGGTRAIILLAKGDAAGCMELNPSAPLLLLCLLYEIRVNYFAKGNRRLAGIFLIGSILFSIIVYVIKMRLYFPHKEPYVVNNHCLFMQFLNLMYN